MDVKVLQFIAKQKASKPDGYDDEWKTPICPVIWGASTTEERLAFKLNEDKSEYIVTGIGSYTGTNVIIPSNYNGKPVTAIGDGAFYMMLGLSSISIPNSITSIGAGAFLWCLELTNITIPSSVKNIGNDAFYLCQNLTIYCEAESKPDGWDKSWNVSNCPVVWGYKG